MGNFYEDYGKRYRACKDEERITGDTRKKAKEGDKMMTYKDAKENGYREADCAYQRGYVSRKGFDALNAEIMTAGGARKGQLYFLRPCFHSSQYCFRQYLVRDED